LIDFRLPPPPLQNLLKPPKHKNMPNENNLQNNNSNSEIGTFDTDAIASVPKLTYNNNKFIPLHDVFQGSH